MNSVLSKFDVKGRSVFVTGGGAGLGLAYAEALAESGASVTLSGRSGANIETQAERMRAQGWSVVARRLDIGDPADIAAAIDEHVARFGSLDAVFANAGIGDGPGFWDAAHRRRNPTGEIENLEQSGWSDIIAINLNGTAHTVSQAARAMKALGRPGSIIVTSSVASTKVFPTLPTAYMVSKAAISHFVRQVALELAEFRIRVNAISPGMFVTNIGGGYLADPAARKAMAGFVPMGDMADVHQIKPLALYLASDASDFMTGAELPIDGGVLLGAFQ
ncbi:SDR family oxidoreductase [Sphingomonas sp.]|uniref:SDR family NAD(P)-dependent oxidoreductase n=1 Tax=Sphingomonas sp. TaxID=28214 RepID=UPI0031E3FE5F